MPIPKPISKETKDVFIKRCIKYLIDEGTNPSQAYAICEQTYDQYKPVAFIKFIKKYK